MPEQQGLLLLLINVIQIHSFIFGVYLFGARGFFSGDQLTDSGFRMSVLTKKCGDGDASPKEKKIIRNSFKEFSNSVVLLQSSTSNALLFQHVLDDCVMPNA